MRNMYLVHFCDCGEDTIRINEKQKKLLDWLDENGYFVPWEEKWGGKMTIIPESNYIDDLA